MGHGCFTTSPPTTPPTNPPPQLPALSSQLIAQCLASSTLPSNYNVNLGAACTIQPGLYSSLSNQTEREREKERGRMGGRERESVREGGRKREQGASHGSAVYTAASLAVEKGHLLPPRTSLNKVPYPCTFLSKQPPLRSLLTKYEDFDRGTKIQYFPPPNI